MEHTVKGIPVNYEQVTLRVANHAPSGKTPAHLESSFLPNRKR